MNFKTLQNPSEDLNDIITRGADGKIMWHPSTEN